MKVVKRSGEEEEFNQDKFCESLKETGAPDSLVNATCALVTEGLEPGITTMEIFRRASRHLLEHNVTAASRYNLKRGMALLGPAGFLFEQFVEIIFKSMGYETMRNAILDGRCVSHEVDIIAKKESVHYFVEAKYHNKQGIKTHVDVVMYADARLNDIREVKEKEEKERAKHSMWLVTNTKYTSNAIKYGKCRNIKMTGWRYPRGESLEYLITKYKIYPVTVLPSVDRVSRERFAEHDMMLAQDIAPHSVEDLIGKIGIAKERAEKILKEAHTLVYGE